MAKELSIYLKPKGRLPAGKQPSIFERLTNSEDLQQVILDHYLEIRDGEMTLTEFWENYAQLVIGEEVDSLGITFDKFRMWYKTFEKRIVVEDPDEGKTLLEKEQEKQTQQIEIRQDATGVMADFLKYIKGLARDKKKLLSSGIKPLEVYKIIREEEDRAKLIALKERAENRADYAFAFLVSMAKANQLSDADIEFLHEDIKKELSLFKQPNGIYQLPSDTSAMAQAVVAAENPDSLADEGYSAGSV